MNRYTIAILLLAVIGTINGQTPRSATDLTYDMYHTCLKDFDVSCVRPKALQWFDNVVSQNEIQITDSVSIVRTGMVPQTETRRSVDPQEEMFDNIDNFLATHALRVKAPEFFASDEARSFIPDFLMDNALTKGAVVPLTERSEGKFRTYNFLCTYVCS